MTAEDWMTSLCCFLTGLCIVVEAIAGFVALDLIWLGGTVLQHHLDCSLRRVGFWVQGVWLHSVQGVLQWDISVCFVM
jgi:hypothetical protein